MTDDRNSFPWRAPCATPREREGKVLKRRFICVLAALALLLCACPGAVAEGVPGVIRLHVVASDDGEAAQALKLVARDGVLAAARERLSDCGGVREAWQALVDHLEDFAGAAEAALRAEGCEDAVRAEAGVFHFPERAYGSVVLPEGDYRALRVVIGAGEGGNWWCVLYPSLCYDAREAPGPFYSSLLRWLISLFGGDGE